MGRKTPVSEKRLVELEVRLTVLTSWNSEGGILRSLSSTNPPGNILRVLSEYRPAAGCDTMGAPPSHQGEGGEGGEGQGGEGGRDQAAGSVRTGARGLGQVQGGE